MLSREDNEFLTRSGPGTPMGDLLRRFWLPALLSEELPERDGAQKKIKILGEDLIVFRDGTGQIGLLQMRCTHRGTSLEFGVVAERGIRCCYHGWVYDVDGTILETPGEPASSTLKDRLCQGAYPVHEYGGLIFAYMGPPAKKPAFPLYDTFELPGFVLMPAGKFSLPCNWLQIKDNSMSGGRPSQTADEQKNESGTEKCIALVYQGEDAVQKIREVLGPTDPSKAPPGSIRKEFGQTIMINAAHASDSIENAQREMKIVQVEENNLKPLIEDFYRSK